MFKVKPLIPVFIIYAILLAIGATVPGMWQPVMYIMFYIGIGVALNNFLGLTGYVDFGYVAFLAMGAYGMAVALAYFNYLGVWEAVALGFALALLFAALLCTAVGGVALRLRGAYFAIATIGVNEGLRYLIEGARIWGGSEGIVLSGLLRKAFGAEMANYLSTVVADICLIIVIFIASVITVYMVNSKVGYALLAVREDEDAAKVMGINVTKYKLIAFFTSASIGALIGASAWTLKLTYVFPEDVFFIHYTVEAIVIVMLGGAGTLLGPVVGGLLYGSLKYYLSVILPGFQLLAFAPLLIIIVVAFPDGVIGWLKKRLRYTKLYEYIS